MQRFLFMEVSLTKILCSHCCNSNSYGFQISKKFHEVMFFLCPYSFSQYTCRISCLEISILQPSTCRKSEQFNILSFVTGNLIGSKLSTTPTGLHCSVSEIAFKENGVFFKHVSICCTFDQSCLRHNRRKLWWCRGACY